MAGTRGTPVLGSRSAHDVTDPDLHASDIENAAFTVHMDPDAAEGEAMVMGPAGKYLATPVIEAGASGGPILPLLAADPASPVDGETWVRKTVLAEGTPIGLLLALTHTLYTRELSVYDGGAVYRTELTIGV